MFHNFYRFSMFWTQESELCYLMSPKIFSVNVHRPKLNCHEWKLTLFKQAKLPTMETKTFFFLYVKGYLTPALIKTAHLVFFYYSFSCPTLHDFVPIFRWSHRTTEISRAFGQWNSLDSCHQTQSSETFELLVIHCST